jgi:pyridoxamine 5'-phosphate oxidase
MMKHETPIQERDLHPDPIVEFGRWFQLARDSGLATPETMTLATSTRDGRPSARIVLLKGFDARGFMFFTHYESRKGLELRENPLAALVFHWSSLKRQVRIEGRVQRTSTEESQQYFDTRPFESRLAAWASQQSEEIPGRQVLEDRVAELRARYPGGEVPVPPFWGGFRVAPDRMEFWADRMNRLHDRFCYRRQATGGWKVVRLSP